MFGKWSNCTLLGALSLVFSGILFALGICGVVPPGQMVGIPLGAAFTLGIILLGFPSVFRDLAHRLRGITVQPLFAIPLNESTGNHRHPSINTPKPLHAVSPKHRARSHPDTLPHLGENACYYAYRDPDLGHMIHAMDHPYA